MELGFTDSKKKVDVLELKLKQTKQQYEKMRSDRNILTKTLLTANVIILLFTDCSIT